MNEQLASLRNLLEQLIRLLRYPLWIITAVVATVGATLPFTDGSGQGAAVLGVLCGGLLGELVGWSRLRLPWILMGTLLGGVGLFVLDWVLVDWWPFPAVSGPASALWVSNVLWFAGGGAVVAATLRALGRRGSLGRTLELGCAAAAVAFVFASHRDGSIARPLWLSDWAWDMGLDPINVILAMGVVLGIILPVLMLLESRRRLPLLAPLLLPILVILAFLWTDPATLQTPPQTSELNDIQEGFAGGGDAQGGDSSASGGGRRRGKGPGGGGSGGEDSGQSNPENGEETTSGNPQESLEEGGGGGQAEPVAVLVLGDDYSPPTEAYYLRQEPHSQFNGTRLIKATERVRDVDFLDHFAVGETSLPPPPEQHRMTVQGTVSLLVEHTAPFGIEAPISYYPTTNPNPNRFVRTFGFVSAVQSTAHEHFLGLAAGNPLWDAARWAHYTEGPDDPRYAALAQQLIAELPPTLRDDPFAQALKIKLYLDENMKYSREARHAHATDPTADFLFGDLVGYCVHSAHAAVFLWRSIGLPARIGTGYLVPEEQRRGSALLVLNNQAHAWPELYLADVGWVVLDIAPAENLDPPGEPLDEALLDALADLAQNQRPQMQSNPIDYTALWRGVLLVLQVGAVLVVMGFFGSHYTVKVWRRMRPRLVGGQTLPRVGYRVTLDWLAEVGWIRESGETREHFAERLSVQLPAFETLTQMHLQAAFGPPDRGVDVASWWQTIRAVRIEIRGQTAWWRRWLGLLNPFSFYRAR